VRINIEPVPVSIFMHQLLLKAEGVLEPGPRQRSAKISKLLQKVVRLEVVLILIIRETLCAIIVTSHR
jgi:hypothetical protein